MSEEIKQGETLANEDWYIALVEDCQAIKTEKEFIIRDEKIQTQWELGKRIKEAVTNDNSINERVFNALASDLGVSDKDLRLALDFFDKFKGDSYEEVIVNTPWDKGASWIKIRQEYLGVKRTPKGEGDKNLKLTSVLSTFKDYMSAKVDNIEEIEKDVNEFRELLINKNENGKN